MQLTFRCNLSISGLRIRIHTDLPMDTEPRFVPFVATFPEADIHAYIQKTDILPALPERVIHNDLCFRVHVSPSGQILRSFFDAPRDPKPYAVAWYEPDSNCIRVSYLEHAGHCLASLGRCFFHLGLESLLARQNRLCLHGSLVQTELGGLIFSGPSGIGKSTQAELWCRHRSARQINGDRPILSGMPEGWYAWGSPYAGSSDCHINERCAIRSIMMLRWDSVCSLRPMPPGEAFRALWKQLTLHPWEPGQTEQVSSMLIDLISSVPVYEFSCTPDEDAVLALEQELGKETC